jgi:hypothetical protein
MSEPRIAALVCEGQTDVPILRAIIQELWPSVLYVHSLQPELDEMGRAVGRAGWTEVRAWCEQHQGDLDDVLSPLIGDSIDLLLVAVDLDIAVKAGIADPPQALGGYESKRLRDTLKGWLAPTRKAKLPRQVVLSTPVMAVEAWVVAALFRAERHPEQLTDPATFLISKKKLRASPDDGRPWKELHRYQEFATRVVGGLSRVRRTCPEANRTCSDIELRRDAVELR